MHLSPRTLISLIIMDMRIVKANVPLGLCSFVTLRGTKLIWQIQVIVKNVALAGISFFFFFPRKNLILNHLSGCLMLLWLLKQCQVKKKASKKSINIM